MDLAKLDRKKLAIHISGGGIDLLLKGTGHYEPPGDRGILVVAIDEDGETPSVGQLAFKIRSDEWDGEVVADTQFGCDFEIRLTIQPR